MTPARRTGLNQFSSTGRTVVAGRIQFRRRLAVLPGIHDWLDPLPRRIQLIAAHEQRLIAHAAEMGVYLETRIADLKEKHPSIGDFRDTGLLGCIELVKNQGSKEPITPWNAKPDQMLITNRISSRLKELGMFTFVRWNYIFIAPPLIITKEQMNQGLEIISKAIEIADEYYEQ